MLNYLFKKSNLALLIYAHIIPHSEDFYYQYNSKEYHYTLYYYDQAGNLVQTVPPNGVDVLDTINFPRGVYYGSPQPQHTYITRYTYNSLNQVVSQETPDGGLTEYYYDSKGRLQYSQNAKQKINLQYSYTVYDANSRIVETGEAIGNPAAVNNNDPKHDVTPVGVKLSTGGVGPVGTKLSSRTEVKSPVGGKLPK